MQNLLSGRYIFVVILALIKRSIETTITKVFKSVIQVIYTWIMLRSNTDFLKIIAVLLDVLWFHQIWMILRLRTLTLRNLILKHK